MFFELPNSIGSDGIIKKSAQVYLLVSDIVLCQQYISSVGIQVASCKDNALDGDTLLPADGKRGKDTPETPLGGYGQGYGG